MQKRLLFRELTHSLGLGVILLAYGVSLVDKYALLIGIGAFSFPIDKKADFKVLDGVR